MFFVRKIIEHMNYQNLGNQIQNTLRYGGKTLLPYQVTGRDYLKSHQRCGLWDDMGLGKTIQSLAAAKDLGLSVSVIGPPKLTLDWQDEAKAVGVELTYYSYQKIPVSIDTGILIIEEAHWLQGGNQTQRGRKGLNLIDDYDGRVWLLTGTPMRNGKPKNLLPLLQILGVVPEQIKTMDYLDRYCCPRVISTGRRLVTVYDGATRLPDLASLIAPYSLRRKKEEELDLPPKIYCERKVPLSKPSLVKAELAKFRANLEAKLEEADRSEEKENLERLLIVSQIKKLSESQKIDYCKDLVEDLEGQTLWFCCYLETARNLSEILGAPKITGETDLKTRHKLIQEYQTGKHQHLILTIRAAGIGITLTAATNEVFVGREWAPEDNLQAEDRAYRIGQTKPLTVIQLSNGLDAHVEGLHLAKSASTHEFLVTLKHMLK